VGSLTDTLENTILDAITNAAAYTGDATAYFAAFTATPSDAGGGTEVTAANAYARVAVTSNTTNFPAASGGSKSNGTAIAWPQATGSWGTVAAVAQMSASSAGTMRYWDDFTGVAIASGDVLEIPVGGLTITLD
jgi:hypothetical protein